ncbi:MULTISPECIES: FAD-dependent oxidoreductase [unclassified Streptomyces]|uniref:NAD(P)/FAD-dependent oxidoreductase n=1 Tax=unclassified Streptomyces TaxID=2593676 RepID=UPI00339886CD
MKNVIVVGGGLAGLRTAMALRTQGYQGELTLVGAEHHRPYDRPPLTKAVLAGESDDTTLPADWERLRCGLRLGQRARALRFHDGRPGGVLETTAGPLDFDGLVIATGATPIRLPGDGPQHVVRTLEDARGLRASLRPGARVLIVGAGWIGAEVATAAAKKGCRVTVLEAAATPLATVLGPELGVLTVGWYAEAGVELRLGAEVASVDHGGVTLTDGRSVPADVVVAGVGARPEVGWLAGSGLDVQRGVVVDSALRTTRAEAVAVGDCAAWWSERYGRRLLVEHWETADKAPEAAAAALLGRPAAYDPPLYFWSEQFGRTVQYAGHHSAADQMVFRCSPDSSCWTALWVNGNRLEAVLAVDRPRDLVQGRRLIAESAELDIRLAADPQVPLRDVVLGRPPRGGQAQGGPQELPAPRTSLIAVPDLPLA